MDMSSRLKELIGEYWNLAFQEGKEGRTHDTEDGKAQKCLTAIEFEIRKLENEAVHWSKKYRRVFRKNQRLEEKL